jgi:hypothetical protein
MSSISVITEIFKWAGHTIKVAEVGASIYDSVETAKDEGLSNGEKAAIITTNSLFGALQLADVGMGVHSTVTNYTRSNSPVKVIRVGSRSEKSRIPSERPSRPAPHPSSIDSEGRIIPGYRNGASINLNDLAIQDSMVPLKDRIRHNVSAAQIRKQPASESKNYLHIRMAVKGATGLADVGRQVVKKICKVRRFGIDVHDYFDILAIICSRSSDCLGFTLEAYPQEFSKHESEIKLTSEILPVCALIFRNTRMLRAFGEMIRDHIQGNSPTESKSPPRPDSSGSQPHQERGPEGQAENVSGSAPGQAASASDPQPHQENGSAAKAEMKEETESAPPIDSSDRQSQVHQENGPILQENQSIQVDIGEGSESGSIGSSDLETEADPERLTDLELGQLMWDEINEALATEDIMEIRRIPRLIREDIVLKNYSCGISCEPIRFIMMVQADIRSMPVYYEREVLETWFQNHPEAKPPQWPEALQNWSWAKVEEFNKDNYVVNSIQKKINKRLNTVLTELRGYDLLMPQRA